MMKNSRTIFFATLAVGALLLAWLPNGPALGLPQPPTTTSGPRPVPAPTPVPAPVPAPQVKLSATTSANSYSAGQPIGIAATLTNASTQSLGLSSLVDGNLIISSVARRDGSTIRTVATMTNYYDGFPTALSGSLAAVHPGGSVTATWTSDFNQAVGGEALLATTYSGALIGSGSYFDLSQPGTYSITFHYQYKGPTASFPGTVFTGKTNSVTVTFTIL
jgi:hypothetical protein